MKSNPDAYDIGDYVEIMVCPSIGGGVEVCYGIVVASSSKKTSYLIYLFDKNRWKWYNDFELTLMSAAEEANGTRKK
tara:strand:- start:294 stop:524 length:231 start_codon:yes stop_codon:yes gene_type:complete